MSLYSKNPGDPYSGMISTSEDRIYHTTDESFVEGYSKEEL